MLTAVSSEPRHEARHRILTHLGQGGTANVYLAVAQGPNGFNKLVVLKVLKENLQSDPEFAAMFLNEARLAARLNHPNIIQTYEVIEDNGVPMMVMEYLEGRPLSALLQRASSGGLSLSVHLRIIADALVGLHYAHELKDFDGRPLGVVHRDATPHNLFVTYEGQAKVLDFGIAKLDVSTVETRAGMLKGKIRYMAPEQIRCQPVDRRADIYSAGVMLWHAAAGEPLWRNMPEASIVARVLSGDIPRPSEVNPAANPRLEAICLKAMAHEREQRHTSAAELEVEIEELLAELGERVTSRDAGKVVSRLFAEFRDSTRMMIEQQLSASASMTWTGSHVSAIPMSSGEPSSARVLLRDMHSSLEPSASSSSAAPTLPGPAGTRSDWRPWAIASAAVLLVVFFLFRGFGGAFEAPGNATTSTSAAPAAAAPPPAPTPAFANLTIRTKPLEAKLFLDDEPLPTNPYANKVPADGAEHVIRAEAAGYSAASRRFFANGGLDLTIELELDRQKPTSFSAARRRSAPAPAVVPAHRAAISAVAGSGSPNCQTPFFIDQRGIKRVLPECM